MKFEDFKAGVFRRQYQYKSFMPALVNHDWTWEDPKINTLLEQATQALGEIALPQTRCQPSGYCG